MTNTTIKCQFCGKPCNTSCCYIGRYAHIGCAESAYLMIDEGIHGIEEWWETDSESRLAELNAATKGKYR